jgi:hypothetical protein
MHRKDDLSFTYLVVFDKATRRLYDMTSASEPCTGIVNVPPVPDIDEHGAHGNDDQDDQRNAANHG